MREANLRLERESDDLAQELITSKIGLRAELDSSEEKADSIFKELLTLRRLHGETEEDRKQIQNEAFKVNILLPLRLPPIIILFLFIYFQNMSALTRVCMFMVKEMTDFLVKFRH